MDLGFENAVKISFLFLEKEYGFKCIESGPYFVKYQSLDVYVSLVFDGDRSYELYCQIGRNDNYRDTGMLPIDLADVINFYLQPHTKYIFCRATDEECLMRYINEYSTYLLEYGKELLNGSRDVFNEIAMFRDNLTERYAKDNDLRQLEVELDRAWKNKNFKNIVELLEPVQENIPVLFQKKLIYAKKMLSKQK